MRAECHRKMHEDAAAHLPAHTEVLSSQNEKTRFSAGCADLYIDRIRRGVRVARERGGDNGEPYRTG